MSLPTRSCCGRGGWWGPGLCRQGPGGTVRAAVEPNPDVWGAGRARGWGLSRGLTPRALCCQPPEGRRRHHQLEPEWGGAASAGPPTLPQLVQGPPPSPS